MPTLKEVLIVGAAAALGEYVVQKYGSAIEAKAVSMKIPPMVAHVAIVGGSAAAGFALLRAVF